MRSEDKRYWKADRVALLDKFAKEVAAGTWHKMPYKIWRTFAHTNVPEVIITKDTDYDACGGWEYVYTMTLNQLNTSTSEDFIADDKSFGAFLDANFEKPTLTSKIAEANNMYNYSDKTTAVPSNSSLTWDGTNLNLNYNFNDTVTTDHLVINGEDNPYWSNTATSIVWKTPCDEDNVRRICKDIIDENKKKENKKMDTSSLFNFDFGPASSNQFRMSPYGLAVRTQANGWVAYNAKTGDLMDVDILNFDISKMIYKMPVALTAIKPGDILMHGGKPVFVREVATGGSTVRVIDYTNATVADILPVKSPFGFNFFTKVCPLFNFDQASANSDNPFGNMLPFLMLNGEKDGSFDPTLLFMASTMNGGNMDFTSNPMMLYYLMNRQDKGDILPFLMMMNGGLTGMGVSTPTSSTPIATATT